ncbi:hypothetical protein BD414DRAFT_417021 [Trametes punicea]|nr:hypothetical protein BD414DRAFT_417021 [Trametes punicea]
MFSCFIARTPWTDSSVPCGLQALLAYEYVITLDQEVRFIWLRKKSGAALLFLAVRYLGLLSLVVLTAGSYAPMSDQVLSCSTYVKVQVGIQFAQYLPWAAFSGLRALALSQMNWTLAAIIFILACGPFAINFWVLGGVGMYGYNIPVIGCYGGNYETILDTWM